MFPNVFQIETSSGNGQMKFFNILNKRCHAFICQRCNWIKIAKLQTSVLRSPDDYVINHDCDGEESMPSATRTSTQNSSLNNTSQEFNPGMNSSLNSDLNLSNPTSFENMASSGSMLLNRSHSLVSNDSNASSLNVSMAASSGMNSSLGSSCGDDSGFRTPENLDESNQSDPLQFYCCKNSFSHASDKSAMTIEIRCQYKFLTQNELKDHKATCALRYKSKMARSNPGYLSKFIWTFSKELEFSDYLGKSHY